MNRIIFTIIIALILATASQAQITFTAQQETLAANGIIRTYIDGEPYDTPVAASTNDYTIGDFSVSLVEGGDIGAEGLASIGKAAVTVQETPGSINVSGSSEGGGFPAGTAEGWVYFTTTFSLSLPGAFTITSSAASESDMGDWLVGGGLTDASSNTVWSLPRGQATDTVVLPSGQYTLTGDSSGYYEHTAIASWSIDLAEAVPEPTSFILMVIGIVLGLAMQRFCQVITAVMP